MIGTILRNIRKIRGLTQSNVGDELHLADNTISNYETEYSSPNFDTIKKNANVCNFEIQFFDIKTPVRYDTVSCGYVILRRPIAL